MKSVYIEELENGHTLENESFMLQEMTQRKTKDGRPYILGNLRDKTGQVACVYWDVPDYVEEWVSSGQIVLVTGKVVTYKDALQITITDMNQSRDLDLEAFLPSSKRPRKEMAAELRQFIASLAEPWQTLAGKILLEEPFLSQFANAPAARSMHHAYIGGLLEHSLSMAHIADYLSELYPHVDRNLLISGALLHDLGKVYEYNVAESFSYSEDGRLTGHIIRAIVIVEKTADAINFPEDKRRQLIHLIASHHGTHEWGAPVLPKTLEAILLHQIDLLDSRVQGFFDHLNNEKTGAQWTAKKSFMFGTELRKPEGY